MVGFVDMVQHCAPSVGISTLAAIVRTESGFNPLAIGINVKKNTPKPKIDPPKTTDDAISTAKWLLEHNYNIDMGLGQINSSNLSKLGLTIDNMFNPCSNISAAGTILKGNYQAAFKDNSNEHAALYAAISAYNTGSPTKGFSNGYVNTVISNANIANIDIQVPELIQNKAGSNNEVIENKISEYPAIKLTKSTPPSKQEESPQGESPESKVMVYEGNKEESLKTIMVY